MLGSKRYICASSLTECILVACEHNGNRWLALQLGSLDVRARCTDRACTAVGSNAVA